MTAAFALPASTRPGPVHLVTRDAARLAAFYQALGFVPLAEVGTRVSLGVGATPLLHVTQDAAAPLPPQRSTGLFHTAFLVPTRAALAQLLTRVAHARVPLHGASDHATHEALYLADPDGNGVELAWDRPQHTWPTTPDEMMARSGPLDLDDLLGAHDPATPPRASLDDGIVVGHVHLRVADVATADAFYAGVLGLTPSAVFQGAFRDQAAFYAAGGYHHHVAANVWSSRGAPAPPPGAVGLHALSLVLPTSGERDALAAHAAALGYPSTPTPDGALLHDPSGNGVLLAAPDQTFAAPGR